jgi:hypothetical protein
VWGRAAGNNNRRKFLGTTLIVGRKKQMSTDRSCGTSLSQGLHFTADVDAGMDGGRAAACSITVNG